MTNNFYNLFGFNESLFMTLNQYTNIGILPNILTTLSSVFFIANFAICYLMTCLYFYYKTTNATNKAAYFTPIYYELVRIGICYTIFGLTFAALKFSINLPRPFCSLENFKFLTIADTSTERCLSSFPSAHTGLALLVTYCLWPYMSRFFKILACAVIIMVAISRITLAMHYPADILYSVIVTILTIIIGNKFYQLLKDPILKPIGYFILQLLFKYK